MSPTMPRGRRLLLVVVTVSVALALMIAGACILGEDERGPANSGTEGEGDAPYVVDTVLYVKLQDYGTLTTEARQFWQDLTLDQVVSHGVPFTRHNRYYTRFFLKEGETAEVFIEANVPLGASLESSHEGISVVLIPGGAPYDRA